MNGSSDLLTRAEIREQLGHFFPEDIHTSPQGLAASIGAAPPFTRWRCGHWNKASLHLIVGRLRMKPASSWLSGSNAQGAGRRSPGFRLLSGVWTFCVISFGLSAQFLFKACGPHWVDVGCDGPGWLVQEQPLQPLDEMLDDTVQAFGKEAPSRQTRRFCGPNGGAEVCLWLFARHRSAMDCSNWLDKMPSPVPLQFVLAPVPRQGGAMPQVLWKIWPQTGPQKLWFMYGKTHPQNSRT